VTQATGAADARRIIRNDLTSAAKCAQNSVDFAEQRTRVWETTCFFLHDTFVQNYAGPPNIFVLGENLFKLKLGLVDIVELHLSPTGHH